MFSSCAEWPQHFFFAPKRMANLTAQNGAKAVYKMVTQLVSPGGQSPDCSEGALCLCHISSHTGQPKEPAVVPGWRGASHCKGTHHPSLSLCLPSPLPLPKGAGGSQCNTLPYCKFLSFKKKKKLKNARIFLWGKLLSDHNHRVTTGPLCNCKSAHKLIQPVRQHHSN